MGERVGYEKKSWLAKGYGLAPFLLLSDPKISVGAKGLFCYLSSIAGAVINEEFGGRASWPGRSRICRDLNINKDTFTAYLDELKSAGFIRVVQKRTSGKFASNVYIIQEIVEPLSRGKEANAQHSTCPKLSDTVLSDTKKPDTTITKDLVLPKDRNINSIYSPKEEEGHVEKPVKQTKKRRKAAKNLHRALRRNYPEDFNRFWSEYPRKEDKAAAFEVYKAILDDRELGLKSDDLVSAARSFKEAMEQEGRERKHIKLCKTWLNNSLAEYLPGTEDYKERQLEDSDPFTFSEEVRAQILGRSGRSE